MLSGWKRVNTQKTSRVIFLKKSPSQGWICWTKYPREVLFPLKSPHKYPGSQKITPTGFISYHTGVNLANGDFQRDVAFDQKHPSIVHNHNHEPWWGCSFQNKTPHWSVFWLEITPKGVKKPALDRKPALDIKIPALDIKIPIKG